MGKKNSLNVSNVKAKVMSLVTSVGIMLPSSVMTAHASGLGSQNVQINQNAPGADQLMGNIIGILLTITMYVGVAMTVYGVYETVMSFTQDMPDKRVKGITLALAGVVMIGLKQVLQSLGVIG